MLPHCPAVLSSCSVPHLLLYTGQINDHDDVAVLKSSQTQSYSDREMSLAICMVKVKALRLNPRHTGWYSADLKP